MDQQEFSKILLGFFPFETTPGQKTLLMKLSEFILGKDSDQIFVLKGYAGTGKTTLVSALVKAMPALNGKTVLLAPTGRAAKVLSNYTQKQAFTIHKKIYIRRATEEGGFAFHLQQNLHSNTVFIIDEASMISNSGGLTKGGAFGGGSLMDDLIEYVFSGTNCKLIFIGDTAQLPPVGMDVSPALDIEFLKASYSFSAVHYELTEVVRQTGSSGILVNATALREQIREGESYQPHFETKEFKDVIRIDGSDLEDALNEAYNKFGAEDTMIVCRSNKRANIYNQQIRARIRWQESELSAGDYMMVVKNNYFWLPEESKAGFIANGDIVEILRVGKVQEMHGFRFADVRMRMIDYPDESDLEVRLLLDTIMSEAPSLSQSDSKKLFDSVMEDYSDVADRRMRLKKVKEDGFFNALQVKFAYSVTCHKAQGGQWPCVFVEQGYLTDEMLNKEYLRWLYTAITRASQKLYLVNFNKEFFDQKS
ncbi:MAG: ATP-dependent endonuclease [Bacteroidetes bacterium]|jgi:exodeoxyribonuclease-5|nr:ATP-dependent endonuclease [Bacteroidota bacterium]